MNASELRIRTPEGIVFSQLLAGPVTRFLAWFVDLLCVMALLMILGRLLMLVQVVSANLAGALYTLMLLLVASNEARALSRRLRPGQVTVDCAPPKRSGR